MYVSLYQQPDTICVYMVYVGKKHCVHIYL